MVVPWLSVKVALLNASVMGICLVTPSAVMISSKSVIFVFIVSASG